MVSLDRPAIDVASVITVLSNSDGGTTRLTRPYPNAVSASIMSPVSNISIACLRPTARPNATAGVVQKSPMETPGVANLASVEATARSQVATN